MANCKRCKGTGRSNWCSTSGKIKGPCSACQPRSHVARAVEKHRVRIWGERARKPQPEGA